MCVDRETMNLLLWAHIYSSHCPGFCLVVRGNRDSEANVYIRCLKSGVNGKMVDRVLLCQQHSASFRYSKKKCEFEFNTQLNEWCRTEIHKWWPDLQKWITLDSLNSLFCFHWGCIAQKAKTNWKREQVTFRSRPRLNLICSSEFHKTGLQNKIGVV